MAVVTTDADGSKDLDNVVKVKFVSATNPPINEKVIIDDGPSVSNIAGINKIRATIGSGDGKTGWVKIKEIAQPSTTKETYVQISKITNASHIADGQGFFVLKRNGAMLGEARDPAAKQAIKTKFGL